MKKNKWLINDNPIEPSDRIKNMSDEELEDEFDRLFGGQIGDKEEKAS